jgi:predicted Fe-Mo cluster-binding NifX family protein
LKIAFTTSGSDLKAPLEPRFGRAPRFLIYDDGGGTIETVDNTENMNAQQGAGIQAAQTLVDQGVGCLVTGHCGPKAYRVLQAAGIAVYTTQAKTIAQALELLQQGDLETANGPNVRGHWA